MNLLKIFAFAGMTQALAISAPSDNPDQALSNARLESRGGWPKKKGCCSWYRPSFVGKGACYHWIDGCDREKYGPDVY